MQRSTPSTSSSKRFARRLAFCAAAVLTAFALQAEAAPSDADFLAARDAYRVGNWAKLDRLAPALKGHVLESYVEYWQLVSRIDSAPPDRVHAFIGRYRDSPLVERLRGDWLRSLGRRQAWSLFDADDQPRMSDDTELACYELQSRRQREGDAALAPARPLWFSGKETPDACTPLFDALIARGDLGVADIWQRFRLAHEAANFRLAARIAAGLPPGERPAAADIDRIDRDPMAALQSAEARGGVQSQTGRELVLYALDRAARVDAVSARPPWLAARKRMPRADQRYGDVLVAYHAARQQVAVAHEWFRDVDVATLSGPQHEWRVRAGLRASSWPDVARAIAAMPAALAQAPEWRYWKARAFAATGRREDADRLYGGLAGEHHFYGLLAAEAIGARSVLQSRPLDAPPVVLAAFGAREGVRRTLKLSQLNMRSEAQREWVVVVRGADDDTLLLASEFARRNKLWDRSINTADRTQLRHDYALRYPTPYRAELDLAAREQGLDAALLYGLVRQESRFVPQIVSSAGAVGLMQVMPATARWVAKQTGRTDFRPTRLDEPGMNVQLGSYYLRRGLDRLDSMPVLAAAAYNAGPGRAQAWRGTVPLEGAIYAETIPFGETRDYVKKVLANAMYYQVELGLPYVSLTERLGTVAPRPTAFAPTGLPELPASGEEEALP